MTIETLKYPDQPNKVVEAIAFAGKAYSDTLAECKDMDPRDAQQAAITAWRCCLPTLENIDCIRAFIACIASGQARRWLTAEDAKALTYTAQLALTAWQENHRATKPRYPRERYL